MATKKKTSGETQPDDPDTQPEPDTETAPDPEPDPEPRTKPDPDPEEEPQKDESPAQPVPVQVGSTPHPTTVRGPIESEFNKQRDDRQQKYREDRVNLEREYLDDVASIQEAKSQELVGAGLNPDGGTPVDYGVEKVA
jgi:hypothetical protein